MGWETFDQETFYRNNRDLQATMEVVNRRRTNSEKHIAWKLSKYGVIRSEHRKIQTRNNSIFGHFSRSGNCVSTVSLFNWGVVETSLIELVF